MASLLQRLSTLARSPQGRRMVDQARRAASDPRNRQKVEGLLRSRLGGRRGGGRPYPDSGGPRSY